MAAGTLGDGTLGSGTLGSSDASSAVAGLGVAQTAAPGASGRGGLFIAGRAAGQVQAPHASASGITAVAAPVFGRAVGTVSTPRAIGVGAGPFVAGRAAGRISIPRAIGTGAGPLVAGRAAGQVSTPRAIGTGAGPFVAGRGAGTVSIPRAAAIAGTAALGSILGRGTAATTAPGAQAAGWLGLPVDADARVAQIGGSAIPRFSAPKDPDDVVDYQFDVSALLSPDDLVVQIESTAVAAANPADVAATAERDLVVLAALGVGQSVVVWLGQGQPGWRYQVSVSFTTQDGRTLHRSGYLKVTSL